MKTRDDDTEVHISDYDWLQSMLRLFVCMSAWLSDRPSVCPSLCLSVCLPVCLPACVHIGYTVGRHNIAVLRDLHAVQHGGFATHSLQKDKFFVKLDNK